MSVPRVHAGPSGWDDEAPAGTGEREALRALERLYRRIDEVLGPYSCAKSGDCCQLALTRNEPYLLPLEGLLVRRALKRQGRTRVLRRADGACPLLDDQRRCSVYPERPFGCRTHFCERATGPSRYPKDAICEASARIVALSDALEPDGTPLCITALLLGEPPPWKVWR